MIPKEIVHTKKTYRKSTAIIFLPSLSVHSSQPMDIRARKKMRAVIPNGKYYRLAMYVKNIGSSLKQYCNDRIN